MVDDPEPDAAPERELKDQRIPVMMSASELEAIDDWGFSRKIRSRSEVIRQLCQVGISYSDRLFPNLVDLVFSMNDELMSHHDETADMVKAGGLKTWNEDAIRYVMNTEERNTKVLEIGLKLINKMLAELVLEKGRTGMDLDIIAKAAKEMRSDKHDALQMIRTVRAMRAAKASAKE